jgi:hypothetical protein
VPLARRGVAYDERSVDPVVDLPVSSSGRAATTVTMDHSRPTVVGMVLRLARNVVPCESVLMHWANELRGDLVVVGASGRAKIRLGWRTALSEPMVGAALRCSGSVISPDRRVLFAPILARARLVAAIELVEPCLAGCFRDDDADAMDGAADLIAQLFM